MRGPTLENISFLIVEDNMNMRRLLSTVLKSFGARSISEARDGADALAWLRSNTADIIVTDYNMEPLDGLQFSRMLRTAPDTRDPYVPIIMVSAHAQREHVMAARDAGVNEYLVKPLTAKALYSRVYAVIQHPRRFVRTRLYFGPDRRRRDSAYKGPERRRTAPEMLVKQPRRELVQDEINTLFNPQ